MQTPTEFELEQLMHRVAYDPVAAREYYLRTRKLKGRKKGIETKARELSHEDVSQVTEPRVA